MQRQESITVLLVDDHDLLRRGIKTMLESEGLRRRILSFNRAA